jgi:hypothetical protein
MRTLPVLFCFARSGGTLANQLLGTHPDCLVLSETNPAATFKPLGEQAAEWLGLIAPDEAPGFELLPYVAKIFELDRRAATRGKTLVIRDWSCVNFIAGCSAYARPSGTLEQVTYFAGSGAALRPLAFVRRAADVCASWRTSFPQFAELQPADFARAYLDYAASVRQYPVVRLEEFRTAPKETTARLFELAGLTTDAVDFVLQNFQNFDRCTGNNTLNRPHASQGLDRAAPVHSATNDSDVHLARDVAEQLTTADRWFGYD